MPIDVETSPPLITGVKIDHHPFEDLVPTRDEDVPWKKKGGEGRLRFNHRGQVACALPVEEYGGGKGDTAEGSSLYRQFFVTLDEAPFLDGYVENRSGLADVDADGRTERSVLVFVRGRTVPRLRRDRVAEAFSIFRRYGCHRSHLSFGD